MIAKVYRRERDWAGNPTNALDDDYLGDVDNIIIGAKALRPVRGFEELTNTEGMIGVPREQASEIVVEQHDRLEIGGDMYAVTSPRLWDYPHQLTGSPRRRYWVQVEADHG